MRLLLIVFCLLVGGTLRAQEIERLVEAERQLAMGDSVAAQGLFKDVLKRYPDSYPAALRLTELNYQRGKYSEAIQYSHITEDILLRKLDSLTLSPNLEREMRFRKDLSALYHFKGKIRRRQHRGPDALVALEKSFPHSMDTAGIYMDKGLVFLELNQTDSAKASFRHAIGLSAEPAGANFNLANIYYNHESYDSALWYYRAATRANPGFRLAYEYIGDIQTRNRNYKQAIESYTEMISILPDEEAYFKRAVLYAELREWEYALSDWDSVLMINPENDDAWRNRGLSNFQVRDYQAAVKDFTNALALDSEPYTYINRGYSYYLMNKPKEALEDLDAGMINLPEYALGYYIRSLTYYRLRKKKKACADLAKAMELGMQENEVDKEILGACY